jgi:N-acylneuraminate cytidylyltransferase
MLGIKIKTLLRSDENATDTASTESHAEFATVLNHDFDVFCLLQATSPMTKVDINAVLDKIEKNHLIRH